MNTSLSYPSQELLRTMEHLIPWAQLMRALPHFPDRLQVRLPGDAETLLRFYLMQQWLGLSYEELMEECGHPGAICDFARWNSAWGTLRAHTIAPMIRFWLNIPTQGPAPASAIAACVEQALKEAQFELRKVERGYVLVSIADELASKAEEEARRKKAWQWRLLRDVAILYGIELFLALLLNAAWVKEATPLIRFAAIVEWFAPTVGYFDRIARYPEGVRVTLAITLMLFPLKVWLAYRWFASGGNAYRQFVVSPLSREKDLTPRDFIRDAGELSRQRDQVKQRSWFAIIFASIMIIAFAVGTVFLTLRFGDRVAAGKSEMLPSLRAAYRHIAHGGLPLW
jgi:hypothetical protein